MAKDDLRVRERRFRPGLTTGHGWPSSSLLVLARPEVTDVRASDSSKAASLLTAVRSPTANQAAVTTIPQRSVSVGPARLPSCRSGAIVPDGGSAFGAAFGRGCDRSTFGELPEPSAEYGRVSAEGIVA